MTLISEIITDAFREGNLIAVGTTPTDAEITEALTLLNRYVASLFTSDVGGQLVSIALGQNNVTTPQAIPFFMEDWITLYVPEYSRLQANLTGPITISLPPEPLDGSRFGVVDNSQNFATNNLTIDANGRRIEGEVSAVLDENGLVREWFYRDDLGEWVKLSTLELTDESPFALEYDGLLSLGLALRLSPRYGAAFAAESQAALVDIRKQFKAQYRQKKEVCSELALSRLTAPQDFFGNFDPSVDFNRGLPRW